MAIQFHRLVTALNWRRLVLWTAVGLVVLVAAALLLLQTTPVQRFLLRQAEGFAREAGVPFTAESLRLNVFRLRVSLSGFVYDKGGMRAEIDNFTAEFPWRLYSAGRITINSLSANGVRIRIAEREPAVSEPSGEPGQLPRIEIARLAVRDGSFTYERATMGLEVPAFEIDAAAGRGTLRLGAPITITPQTFVRIPEVPLQLSPDGVRFGPLSWSVQYGNRAGSGLAEGSVRWSPSIAASLNFTTDTFAVEPFDGLGARGVVTFDNGVLELRDFHVSRGAGELTGSATISDQAKTARLVWNNVRLDPSGLSGVTSGQLDLNWTASDFGDIAGTGRFAVSTRDYGRASSDVLITAGRVHLNVRATSMGANISAAINTGVDRRLSGSFRATHRQYGLVIAEGRVGGTLTSPSLDARITADGVMYREFGPVNASGRAVFRQDVLEMSLLNAQFKNSTIPDGALRVNTKTRALEGSIPAVFVQLNDFVEGGEGQIESSANIAGSLDHPSVTVVASSEGLDIQGTHIDSVEASGVLDGTVLELEKFAAHQGEGILEASGVVDLSTEQTRGSLHVSGLELTQVKDFSGTVNLDADVSGSYRSPSANFKGEVAGIRYAGRDHGSVTFSGTAQQDSLNLELRNAKYSAAVEGRLNLKAPFSFTAEFAGNQSEIEEQGYAFVANGRAQVSGSLQPFTMNALQVEGFTLAGEGIDLKADGSLGNGVRVELAADLARVPVKDLELGGQVRADAVVRGPLDNLQVDGEARTSNATFRAMQMAEAANVEAAIEFTQDRFAIRDMRAAYAGARVSISGGGTIRGTGEFTFEAENIRPQTFLPGRPLSGVLGVAGSLKVNAPRLESIEGLATVTQLELSSQGVEVRQVEKGEIALADQIVSIQNLIIEGPETRASAGGSVNLGTGALSLDLMADTDLRIVEGFVPGSSAFGRVESRVAVRGTTAEPDMTGFVSLSDAQFQISEPVLLFSGINAKIQLTGNRAEIEQISGELNDGRIDVQGSTGFSSGGLQDAAIVAKLQDTELEYPKGLQSEVAASLKLNGSSPNLTIAGNVNVIDALYREDISLREQVLQRLTTQSTPFTTSPETPGLAEQVSLDVEVNTTGPVSVINNVARLDLTGTFRVRGTLDDPIVLGRASTLEGGEIYFGPTRGGESAAVGERQDRYIIERGTVDFNNPLQTEPAFDIEATHELRVKDERYLVRLTVTGTPSDLRTELTSDPYLSETDIIAMLLTGRSFAELQNEQVAVAREQVADYLSGQLTSRFFQNAGNVIGLDTVTIEPANIASQEDISARLTVGKDITQFLNLVYSQNLSGPRNTSWILNYRTSRDFVVRGINLPNEGTVRLELQHGLEFGGGPPLPRRIAPRNEATLNTVKFLGTTFDMKELMKQITKPGKPYGFVQMNDDVQSLTKFFASNGYADARIRPSRVASDGHVNVTFNVEQGPKIDFVYRGFDVSSDLRKAVVQVWVDERSEILSLRESVGTVLRYLRDEGYLQATVTAENEAQDPNERLYAFQIDAGMKFELPEWVWKGLEPREIPESTGAVMADPEAIRNRILAELRGSGFLDATCTVPELELGKGRPQFVVSVDRGRQYTVSSILYNGNKFFDNEQLTRAVILGPTPVLAPDRAGATRPPEAVQQLKPSVYTSEWVGIARRRIMTEYWQQGFNDVQVSASTNYMPGSGRIEVSFDIREGERQEIADIRITGDEKTLRSHIMRYFNFKVGDPVDYTRINLTRKELYDTGLFKRVDFEILNEPQGYVAVLRLNERAPWSLRYGFAVSDHLPEHDRSLGVVTNVTYRNLFGTGISTGLATRWDNSVRDVRLYGSFPIFFNKNLHSTATLFRTRETLVDSVSNEWGVTLQQQWRLRDFYVLSYDYSYRRVSTFERDLTIDDPNIVNGVVPVAQFNVTVSRDTRDDILNATRGTFLSNSFDFSPPGIGSSVQFVQNYTQYLRFRRVRPNLVYASAYRLGLAHGFGGQSLLPTDLFTAGGSSLRAFDEDAFEPGNVLVITNQELRFPLFWRFGAATFVDIGNVYDTISGVNLGFRYSPGAGLRINTPFILLRVDFGWNLWWRTDEDHRRISFGIGQAF